MLKLICLVLGLVAGFGVGLSYGVNHPKEAADLAAKQDEWIRKGKEQALQQVKDKLDGILNQQKTAVAAPSAPGFARSFMGGGSGGSGSSQTDALTALKGDVETQLNQVKTGK